MKKHFLKISTPFVLLFLLTLLFSSCQKAENFQDLDLLIDKDWKLVKVTEGTSDITKACDVDDILKFTDTESYEISFGERFCDENIETNTTSEDWKFRENFTQLRLKSKQNFDSGSAVLFMYWDIIELTENTLILRDGTAEDNDIVPIVKEYSL